MSLGRYQDSLHILEELKRLVPKEAPIPVMMGKIYKKQGNKAKALAAFNEALELDPKDTNMVKTLIEKLHQADDMSTDNEIRVWKK